jgi:hypothetical protein
MTTIDRTISVLLLAALSCPAAVAAQAPTPGAPTPQSGAPGMPAGTTARPGAAGNAPGAPPRDPAEAPAAEKGTGVVRGRVVALDTGLPLRRANVMLHAAAGKPRAATTDAEGAFSFTQVPAGRCDVWASKARYIGSSLGARRPGGPGKPIQLAEGQTVEGLVIALAASGVITGRVVDDAGDPVTDVSVTPMRYVTINGERRLVEVGRFRTTDDTGAFRLFGLRPAKYYVSVQTDESHHSGFEEAEPDAVGFTPTFYPGTANAAEAQPIEVIAGAEVVADVQIITARLSRVTGIVVDQAGATASGGYVMVMTQSGNGSRSTSGGPIKADGTFSVDGITPGEHRLVAQATFGPAPMFESFGNGGESRRLAYAEIVANGSLIAGQRLVVQDPIRIPVNVTFEDGADKPEGVEVSANADRAMSSSRAIMRDGRLSLEVVPGTYRLSAGTMIMPGSGKPSWFVKRLAYRGRELEDQEVELTAEPGGRIDVVFTTRSSSVSGSVTDDAGKPIAEYIVIIVPDDPAALRRGTSGRIQVATPGAEGRFDLKQLRPGSYVAAAIADGPLEDVYDVDFLESIQRLGEPFTVTEGGTATVALKLTTLP